MTNNTKGTIVEQSALQHMADLFKVLGDPTRMRILFLISSKKICVSEIADVLQISESAVSHHLQVMRLNHIVRRYRNGKSIYYNLDDKHILTIIQQGREHIEDTLAI